jgi:hypothetical protein
MLSQALNVSFVHVRNTWHILSDSASSLDNFSVAFVIGVIFSVVCETRPGKIQFAQCFWPMACCLCWSEKDPFKKIHSFNSLIRFFSIFRLSMWADSRTQLWTARAWPVTGHRMAATLRREMPLCAALLPILAATIVTGVATDRLPLALAVLLFAEPLLTRAPTIATGELMATIPLPGFTRSSQLLKL